MKHNLLKALYGITAMTLPGFTAESAQSYNSSQYSENVSFKSDSAERIIPAAPYWGDFRREGCYGCDRKYSAILWGLDWGDPWELACKQTPAWITNADGEVGRYTADYCDPQLFNVWGVFFVGESSCYQDPSCELGTVES